MSQDQYVRTMYEVVDRASQPLTTIAQSAMALPNLFSSITQRIFSLQGALMGGAVGMFANGLVNVAIEAEKAETAIAGIFTTYDRSGTLGFSAARQMSQGVLAELERMAAVLPGETADYVTAYSGSLSAMLEVGVNDVVESARLAADFTAVAITKGHSAMQAGSDLTRMMQGHAGLLTPMWRDLQALVSQTARDMHLNVQNASEFNRLRPDQRLALVRGAIERYRPLLGEFGNTWDAVAGTFTSNVTLMRRALAGEFYDTVKRSITELNTLFDQNRQLVLAVARAFGHVGAVVSNQVVAAVRALGGALSSALTNSSVLTWLARVDTAASRVAATLGGPRGITALLMLGGMLTGGVGAAMAGAAVGSVATSPHLNTHGDVTAMVDWLTAALVPAARAFDALAIYVGAVSDMLAALAAPILPAIGQAVYALVDGVAGYIESTGAAMIETLGFLYPYVLQLSEAIGAVATQFAGALTPAIEALAWLVSSAFDLMRYPLLAFITVLTVLVRAVGAVARTIAFINSTILWSLGLRRGNAPIMGSDGGEESLGGRFGKIVASFNKASEVALTRRTIQAAPPVRPHANTHNDFRHSRFDITQKFDKDMDADRVAVTFARDLNRTTEHRLMGQGLAPFGTPF